MSPRMSACPPTPASSRPPEPTPPRRPGADPDADAEGVTETSAEAPDDVAGGSSGCCSAARPRWGAARCPEGAGVEPVTARRFWHAMGFQNVEDDEAMFTEADLEALKRVARLISESQVSEELALGHDPGLRPHRRPARGVADPARRRVARPRRSPRSSRAATAARCPSRRSPPTPPSCSRRSPTTSSPCSSTSGAATSPTRSPACSRMPTRRCTPTRPPRSGSSASPTWSRSPPSCAG